jgi:hypothetical protein
MLKLLERNIAQVDRRLVLLAPPDASVYASFTHVDLDAERHRHMLRDVQRLRGGIYYRDGAIDQQDLTEGGLHRTPEDEKSWHLLMTDGKDRVTACVWYLEHDSDASLDHLRVRNCPLGTQAGWRDTLKRAVENELARARTEHLRYAEVGGWAVAEECRCKSEGLLLALAAYSLGRIAGGALGITTATVRHSSSTILRRLGGQHLHADGRIVPPYYDPRYDCEMELLRFDSRRPNAKYSGVIDILKEKLANVLVLAPRSHAAIETSFDPRIPLQVQTAAA